jgi:hypothetical protein
LNFTFTLTKPEDGEYGVRKNGSGWTGMVGMLVQDKIDIGRCIENL